MCSNTLASAWFSVIPRNSVCLLIWLRIKSRMSPVELVSASRSGKGNNVSISGKETEPGPGESLCFKKKP